MPTLPTLPPCPPCPQAYPIPLGVTTLQGALSPNGFRGVSGTTSNTSLVTCAGPGTGQREGWRLCCRDSPAVPLPCPRVASACPRRRSFIDMGTGVGTSTFDYTCPTGKLVVGFDVRAAAPAMGRWGLPATPALPPC